MALCTTLVGVPDNCGDNNLGSLKRALIASFADVSNFVVSTGMDPDTDGEVSDVTMETGTKFEEFIFVKDTSMFTEDLVVDVIADTNSFSQTLEMGFRRIDLRKRNAIMLLTEGRRDLIAIVQDTNNDYWMLGSDQGMRVSASSATTNNTRSAGQATPVTLLTENEKYKAYKVDPTIVDDLLIASV